MSNEIIFLAATVVNLALMLFCWRLGKNWLMLIIVLNYVMGYMVISKLFTLFGLQTTVGTLLYSSVFIGTDIITEHFGKRAGYRVVWMGFLSAAFLVWIQQVTLLFDGLAISAPAGEAMEVLFATSVPLLVASLSAYLIAQRFDIWLYHFIHKKTQGRMLWLRNNASTIASQALDTLIVGTFAYIFGIFPREAVVEIMLVAYLVKIAIAVIDTPVIYLSYWIRGWPLSRAHIVPKSGKERESLTSP